MRVILSLFFVLCACSGYAQHRYQLGLLPSVNVNKKLPRDFSVNLKVESRQLFKNGFFDEPTEFEYDYVLTDYTAIVAKKFGIGKTAALGYLFRVEEGEIIHRSIQQLIFTKRYPRFRLAHRIATDQTFAPSEETEFRGRYRLAAELPFNGQSVDAGEWYGKAGNEYLYALQGGEGDVEIRLVPFIGYAFSDGRKIEVGLDYRLSSLLNGVPRSQFWWGINYFYSM